MSVFTSEFMLPHYQTTQSREMCIFCLTHAFRFMIRHANWCDSWRPTLWFAPHREVDAATPKSPGLPFTHCRQGEKKTERMTHLLAFCIAPFCVCNPGLQHDVICGDQPYGLPLKEKLMPQYLAPLGYRSHIVGKVRFHVNVIFSASWCCGLFIQFSLILLRT